VLSGSCDARELVTVNYAPLPFVIDAEAALADGAPLLFEEHGSNLAMAFEFGEDPDLLADAEGWVAQRIENQRLAAVPMEPNGIVVTHDGAGLTCYIPTQAAHGVQPGIAAVAGREAEQVRVIAPAVGGGFGAKTGMYAEYAIAVKAAQLL